MSSHLIINNPFNFRHSASVRICDQFSVIWPFGSCKEMKTQKQRLTSLAGGLEVIASSWEVPAPSLLEMVRPTLGAPRHSAGGRPRQDPLSSPLDVQHGYSWLNHCYILALF